MTLRRVVGSPILGCAGGLILLAIPVALAYGSRFYLPVVFLATVLAYRLSGVIEEYHRRIRKSPPELRDLMDDPAPARQHPVEVLIYRDGIPIGYDFGVATFLDGLLNYSGLCTEFSFGSDSVVAWRDAARLRRASAIAAYESTQTLRDATDFMLPKGFGHRTMVVSPELQERITEAKHLIEQNRRFEWAFPFDAPFGVALDDPANLQIGIRPHRTTATFPKEFDAFVESFVIGEAEVALFPPVRPQKSLYRRVYRQGLAFGGASVTLLVLSVLLVAFNNNGLALMGLFGILFSLFGFHLTAKVVERIRSLRHLLDHTDPFLQADE